MMQSNTATSRLSNLDAEYDQIQNPSQNQQEDYKEKRNEIIITDESERYSNRSDMNVGIYS